MSGKMDQLDRNTYDYVPYDGSNVLHQVPQVDNKQLPIGLSPDPFLSHLLYRLVKYHPDWKFISERRYVKYVGARCDATRYYIFAGMEYLGYIDVGLYRDGERSYGLGGPRFDAADTRKSLKYTKDLKKAIKIADEFFKCKTLKEQCRGLITKAQVESHAYYATKERVYSHVVSKLIRPMADYVVDQLPEFIAYLDKAGTSYPEGLTNLKAILEERDQAIALRDKTGYVVITSDNTYLLCRIRGGDKAQYIETDEIPPEMRGKLGMLKLLDVGAIVPEIGIRLSDTGFFIMEAGEVV
jgi:hypothetical protein